MIDLVLLDKINVLKQTRNLQKVTSNKISFIQSFIQFHFSLHSNTCKFEKKNQQ